MALQTQWAQLGKLVPGGNLVRARTLAIAYNVSYDPSYGNDYIQNG